MKLVEKVWYTLKFTYLPQISNNINKAKVGLENQWKKQIRSKIFYCYCTKSSHFEFIMNEAFKNNIHVETSSAFDINIVENLMANENH
jgi:arginine decarboxylase